MNKGVKIGLGCLLAPIGIAVISVVFFAGLHMAGVPEPDQGSESIGQALPAPPTELVRSPQDPDASAPGGEAISFPTDRVALVVLELEEGYFEVFPGPASEGIKVTADYDQATYELKQSYDMDGDRPVYLLQFRSKISFWRRIAADGSFSDEDMENNHLQIQLPVDTPMDLSIKIDKSESTVELDGLALANLETDFSMGEFEILINEPNPIVMEKATFGARMGEFRVEGISFLSPATVETKGGMGEVTLDWGGPLRRDTEIITHMRMGELNLRLPDNARWDPQNRIRATWGEVSGDREGDPDAMGPLLSIDANVFMGEMVIDRYRVRAAELERQRVD